MENCPYHDSSPVQETRTARKARSATYVGRNGAVRGYMLPEITLYKIYCRACRDEQLAKGKIPAKFGKGIKALSAGAAERRWDSDCMAERLRIFKNAVAGKGAA